MFILTPVYGLFEFLGPLKFYSIQIDGTVDPELLPGLTTNSFSWLFLLPGAVWIPMLLRKIIVDGQQEGGSMLLKDHRWRIILVQILALATSILPLALLYLLFPPESWAPNASLFAADLVMQGRFWWGMVMIVLGQLYLYQYQQKFAPDQIEI
jgi:hypothetical protein